MNNESIYLKDIFSLFWREKRVFITSVVVFSMLGAAWVFGTPSKYESSVLVMPVDNGSDNNSLAALNSQFGGLASLAGVNLSGSKIDKATLAIETIKSRQFLDELFQQHNWLSSILAVENWDKEANKFSYNKELYSAESGAWTEKVQSNMPLYQWKAYKKFRSSLDISEVSDTGLVLITYQHYSPNFAQEVVTELVKSINDEIRTADLNEAQKSIEYLSGQANKMQLVNMKSLFLNLMQEQMQKRLLAEVREEYVFKTIDPAIVSQERASPNRILMLITTIILGFLVGAILAVLRNSRHKN